MQLRTIILLFSLTVLLTPLLSSGIIELLSIFNFAPSAMPQYAFALDFLVRVNEKVFGQGDDLIVYGKTDTKDIVIVRIYDPDGTAIRVENIFTDEDGFFRQVVFKWPEPSKNLAFGTYTVEARSSANSANIETIEVSFAEIPDEGTMASPVPVVHVLAVKLDSPDEISVKKSFRIYVQVTFDGALVNADPMEMLGSSHIHSGDFTINLSRFTKLHEGIYYTDVTLESEGSYVIHLAAFYRGFLSHDSKIISVSASSIGTVQETVNELGQTLDETNKELTETKVTINNTRSAITESVDEARTSIKQDVDSAKDAVQQLEQASGQVNSLILPVLVLISIIIALQISLFARIRASYK